MDNVIHIKQEKLETKQEKIVLKVVLLLLVGFYILIIV